MEPKEPKPKIILLGQDGNAMVIMGISMRALRHSGLYIPDELMEIQKEFISGD